MQQRLLQFDYTGALELAKGDAARDVEKAKSDCSAKPQECAMQRKQHEKTVESSAALLERMPTGATARVTSVTPGGKQVSILKLERDGGIWKVVSRMPDDGSFKPAPRGEPQNVTLTLPPGGSAAVPIGSAPHGAGSGAPSMRLVPRTAPTTPATVPAPAVSK